MTKKLVNIREIKPNTDNPRIIKDHKFKKLDPNLEIKINGQIYGQN